MSNKYPQYFTPDGFQRSKKRPSTKRRRVEQEPEIKRAETRELVLSTKVAQRVMKKRKLTQRNVSEERTISPAAAKAIAEALKGMLHS